MGPKQVKDEDVYYTKENVSLCEYKMHKLVYNLHIVNIPKIISYNKETKYEHRDDLIDALPSLIGNGKGVEIGVFKGHFSKVILSKWEGTLYMVDLLCEN